MKNNLNKKTKKLCIYISVLFFIICFVFPMVSWMFIKCMGLLSPALIKKVEFDTGENRSKEPFPKSIISSSFSSDFELWFNDRVPYRSSIYVIQRNFFNSIEKPYKENIRPFLIKIFHPNNTKEMITVNNDERSGKSSNWKAGHNYRLISEIKSTCTTDGQKVYKCKDCQKIHTVVVSAAHNGTKIKVVEASFDDFGYTLNKCKICGAEYRTDIVTKPIDTSFFPLVLSNNAFEGRHNWLFYKGDNSIDYYKGTNLLSEETMVEYANTLQQLHDICKTKGVQLQIVFIPNKEQIYYEYMPSIEIANDTKRVESFVEYLNKNTDVNATYLYNELIELKPYWQLYRKHDTHWSNAGGFVGLQAIYKSMGLPSTSLMNLPVTQFDITGGDLINIGSYNESDYPFDIEYNIDYHPEIQKNETPDDDLEFDAFQSTNANGKNLVYIGDSFRMAVKEFAPKDFETSVFVHVNSLKKKKTVDAIKNANVIIISFVERYDYRAISSAKAITDMLS